MPNPLELKIDPQHFKKIFQFYSRYYFSSLACSLHFPTKNNRRHRVLCKETNMIADVSTTVSLHIWSCPTAPEFYSISSVKWQVLTRNYPYMIPGSDFKQNTKQALKQTKHLVHISAGRDFLSFSLQTLPSVRQHLYFTVDIMLQISGNMPSKFWFGIVCYAVCLSTQIQYIIYDSVINKFCMQ